MSNLLSQASLVMIPSGYKEDVVYSQIPTNGNGDLTWTRASDAWRTNADGLIQRVPWNLVQYSEQFNNAFHFPQHLNAFGSGSVANTTATLDPNGTNFADYIQENSTASAQHSIIDIFSGNVLGTTYTWSVFAKVAERTIIQLANNGGGGGQANFNLSTGVATLSSGVSASMQNVGNGWWRCVLTYTSNTTGNHNVQIRLCDALGNATYTGNGTSGIYIWGAQLNIGSISKPYFPTTDRLNVPRLTYQNGGGGCPSLLLEPQRTNLALWSEDFSNASWSKTATSITANSTTSPDGTSNADKLIVNNSASIASAYVQQVITKSASSITYSYTCYAKQSELNAIKVYVRTSISAVNFAQVFYNINDGSVITAATSGGTFSAASSTITSVANGFYRINLTFTSSADTQLQLRIFPWDTVKTTGNGTDGIIIYGAQLEAGSYPTTYIPTTSSSATRVADACYKTGISSLIGQTEGTLFINMNINKRVDLLGTGPNGLQIKDTSGNNVIIIGTTYFTNQQFSLSIRNSGSFSNLLTTTNNSLGTYKLAASYNSSGFVFYVNGVQIGTSATPPPSATFADIGVMQVFNINNPEGELVNEAIIFPTRLTNAELASLTTI